MLLVLAVAFLLLFYWQRSRSDFLRIDSQRLAAETIAQDLKVPVADVLALRDMIGLDASDADKIVGPVLRSWIEPVVSMSAASS